MAARAPRRSPAHRGRRRHGARRAPAVGGVEQLLRACPHRLHRAVLEVLAGAEVQVAGTPDRRETERQRRGGDRARAELRQSREVSMCWLYPDKRRTLVSSTAHQYLVVPYAEWNLLRFPDNTTRLISRHSRAVVASIGWKTQHEVSRVTLDVPRRSWLGFARDTT